MKKIISLVLALMMLALPVMGLADDDFVSEALEDGRAVNAALTFRAGDITGDNTMDSVIQDVLKALKLDVSFQDGENPQGGLTVTLSDKEIITLDAAQAQEAVYLLCNMLGEKAVLVKAEDVEPLIKRFIDMFEQMGALSSYEAKALKAQLEEAFAQGMAAGAGNAIQITEIPEIPEPDMSALIAFMADKVKEEAVTMQPRNSDLAVKKVVVSLTGEDLEQIVKLALDAVRSNEQLMDQLNAALAEEGMTAEEAFAEAENEVAGLSEVMAEPLVIQIYLDDEDEPVYATVTFVASDGSSSVSSGSVSTGKIGSKGSSQSGGAQADTVFSVDVNYARLTMNDVETHAANVIIKADEETIGLTVNVVDGEDNEEIRLDMTDGVNQIGVYVTHNEKEEGEVEMASTDVNFVLDDSEMSMNLTFKVDQKVKEDGPDAFANCDVALLLDQTELFGLTANITAADPEASIVTENALRLAEISDEDFNSWFMDTVNGLQLWAMTALQALPASVLMLMMGQ